MGYCDDEVSAVKQEAFNVSAYRDAVDDVFQQVATEDGAIGMFGQSGDESFIG